MTMPCLEGEAMKTFGAMVKKVREAKGITKAAAAKSCGWVWEQWHQYEADRRVPSVLIGWRIADALGVGLDELRPEE